MIAAAFMGVKDSTSSATGGAPIEQYIRLYTEMLDMGGATSRGYQRFD